jgi:hypothetical protein
MNSHTVVNTIINYTKPEIMYCLYNNRDMLSIHMTLQDAIFSYLECFNTVIQHDIVHEKNRYVDGKWIPALKSVWEGAQDKYGSTYGLSIKEIKIGSYKSEDSFYYILDWISVDGLYLLRAIGDKVECIEWNKPKYVEDFENIFFNILELFSTGDLHYLHTE